MNSVPQKISALFVDDSDLYLSYYRSIFIESMPTLRFMECKSGQDAIELYRQNCLDIKLVLVDQRMDPIDGIEITRQIRKLCPPNIRPKIALITARIDEEDQKRIDETDFDYVAIKPITVPKLKELINDCYQTTMSSPLACSGASDAKVPLSPVTEGKQRQNVAHNQKLRHIR